MKIKSYLKTCYFKPNIVGFFINPFFLTRSRLYFAIVRALRGTQFDKVLDFGCGEKPYDFLFQQCDYIGVDIETSGHDNTNSNIDIFYDGNVLPFAENCFDLVFSSEVFEHVFNLPQVLFEINRVLTEDGVLVLTVPFAWPEHEQPYDYARYTQFGMEEILTSAGFELEYVEKTGTYISVLGQLFINYIYMRILPKNKYARILCGLPLSLITIFTLMLEFILPSDKTLFHNQVIRARKIRYATEND